MKRFLAGTQKNGNGKQARPSAPFAIVREEASGAEAPRAEPKLLDRVREVMRFRHYSLRTEEAYWGWIRRFILFHGKRHPSSLGTEEVRAFLTDLAVNGKVAAPTQNQALSALLFLYQQVLEREIGWLDDVPRAQRPTKMPVVCTAEESAVAFMCGQGKHSTTDGAVTLWKRATANGMCPLACEGR